MTKNSVIERNKCKRLSAKYPLLYGVIPFLAFLFPALSFLPIQYQYNLMHHYPHVSRVLFLCYAILYIPLSIYLINLHNPMTKLCWNRLFWWPYTLISAILMAFGIWLCSGYILLMVLGVDNNYLLAALLLFSIICSIVSLYTIFNLSGRDRMNKRIVSVIVLKWFVLVIIPTIFVLTVLSGVRLKPEFPTIVSALYGIFYIPLNLRFLKSTEVKSVIWVAYSIYASLMSFLGGTVSLIFLMIYLDQHALAFRIFVLVMGFFYGAFIFYLHIKKRKLITIEE